MSDVIEAGREAWGRIKERHRVTWDDWLCVGRALLIGRGECMKAAGTNSPKGGKYNYVAAQWLVEHGFADVCAQERSRIVKIVENLPAVEAWRATLPPEEQRKLNHPSLWFRFCASVDGRPMPRRYPPNPGPRLNSAHLGNHNRPIFWPQDSLRRAHQAMLDCGSNDLLKLARVALEAAVRSEADLIALLDAHPKQTHQIRKPAAPRQIAPPIAATAALELSA